MSWFRGGFGRGPVRMVAALTLALGFASPAASKQWVSGKIERISDFTAYNGPSGLYISLKELMWGSGSPQDGPSQCPQYFRIALGELGIDEAVKNRAWATLLTAYSSGQRVNLYVDTAYATCAVQIVGMGGTTPP